VRRNGSNPLSITLPTLFGRTISVAVDGLVYWAEGGAGTGVIKRVSLDGSMMPETVVGGTLNLPRNAAVDATHVYWSEANGAIQKAPLAPGGPISSDRGAVPTFINCLFSGNAAVDNGGAYAGVAADPVFLNCTVVGNTAGTQTGGLRINGDATHQAAVTNCILFFNTDSSGLPVTSQQVRAVNGIVLSVAHSCVQGGIAGAGNVSVDPQFVDLDGPDGVVGTIDDSPRPMPGSPVNDAGSTPLATDLATDLHGSPRRMDDRSRADTGVGPAPIVDMGAYEQPRCRADWTMDGVLNSQDFFDYLSDFFAADPVADFNFSGVVNSQDFFDFLAQFFAGC
jgi:hypothetical protein